MVTQFLQVWDELSVAGTQAKETSYGFHIRRNGVISNGCSLPGTKEHATPVHKMTKKLEFVVAESTFLKLQYQLHSCDRFEDLLQPFNVLLEGSCENDNIVEIHKANYHWLTGTLLVQCTGQKAPP